MSRPKTQTDEQVLDAALEIVREAGIGGLTFSKLAGRTGLSAPTLVQRFANKPVLIRRTLLRAWDLLEVRTRQLDRTLPPTAEGAIDLLVALSGQYAGRDSFSGGLLLLSEDVRDADLSARGAAWETQVVTALNARLASGAADDIGYALAECWQGVVIWWAFTNSGRLEDHLRDRLSRFLRLVGR